ncbi:MAG TPA: energy transducer TonB [Patescibacteria group bacterium]|nr:energy transducer TonB [Patescibacteria group bacterium]
MIRPARWLPLSLAVHAAAFGGGVWLAREPGERALFLDMTPRESEADSALAERPAASPAPAKRAAPPARPGDLTTTAAMPQPTVPAPAVAAAPPAAPEPAIPSAPLAGPAPAIEAPPAASAADPVVASGAPLASQTPGRATGGAPLRSDGAAGDGGPDPVPALAGARGGAGGDGPLALAVPGDGGAGAYGPYLAALRRRLQEALEYPAAARRRGLSGTVHLEIALEATGRVSEVMLVRSSSHAVLDDAALDAARGLRRVPFPPDVRPRALRVRLPVVFELR